MRTISITFPAPLLERMQILAAARRLDVEACILDAVTRATLGPIRGWRGEGLITIIRETIASLHAPIAESVLQGQWATRHPGRAKDFEIAILELVADGILLSCPRLGYHLSVNGLQLLRASPG